MFRITLFCFMLFGMTSCASVAYRQEKHLISCYESVYSLTMTGNNAHASLLVLNDGKWTPMPFIVFPGYFSINGSAYNSKGIFLVSLDSDSLFYPFPTFILPNTKYQYRLVWETNLVGFRYISLKVEAKNDADWSFSLSESTTSSLQEVTLSPVIVPDTIVEPLLAETVAKTLVTTKEFIEAQKKKKNLVTGQQNSKDWAYFLERANQGLSSCKLVDFKAVKDATEDLSKILKD